MHLIAEHPLPPADARTTQRPPTPLDSTDVVVLGFLLAAVAGFALYGLATGAPSTVSYVCTVFAGIALVLRFRPPTAGRSLTVALAVLAVAHLAGGLIRVGHDVLYNASIGSHAVEYDHFVHATGVFLGVVVCWTFLMQSATRLARRPVLIGLCVLAGFGLGAINETVEYLTTLAHDGSHVGGYANTGWDLVSNVVGGLSAGLWLHRHRAAAAPASTPNAA